tara:strand:+ start:521892 stop:522395 length:504 start_codon:yes stop_codon:yes gene_type:complete
MKSKLKQRAIPAFALCLLAIGLTSSTLKPVNGGYDYLKQRLEVTKAFTIEVFNAMPEADYNFKPNDEQRTFGAQAYHIAYSIDYFRRAFQNQGQAAWSPGDENAKSKAELIKWAGEQFDAMHKLILSSESSDTATAQVISYLDHNAHHRGQMVSYLRMKGIKPPAYR